MDFKEKMKLNKTKRMPPFCLKESARHHFSLLEFLTKSSIDTALTSSFPWNHVFLTAPGFDLFGLLFLSEAFAGWKLSQAFTFPPNSN